MLVFRPCDTGSLGARKCQFLNTYSLKTRNILKSIIEQKLLKMMLLTIYHFFDKRPHKGGTGSAPKMYFAE